MEFNKPNCPDHKFRFKLYPTLIPRFKFYGLEQKKKNDNHEFSVDDLTHQFRWEPTFSIRA